MKLPKRKKQLHELSEEEFKQLILEGLNEAARKSKKPRKKLFDPRKGEYYLDPGVPD